MPTTFKQIIVSAFVACMLSSCVGKTVPVSELYRPEPLQITTTPLKLSPVKWKVVEIDGKLWFAIDAYNYSNLATNFEEIQAKLIELQTIIAQQQDYYNN